MAGGWEEVTAAGSWIGTGAGTSGELNKHGEAGEAAVGKYGVGEATAVQANCICLMSRETVTLNFLKIQCPEWDQPQRLPKTGCKKFALELNIF
jgi:hypothetical protein